MRYRVGEMLLSASGTFSADSGRSIFLEQHLEQRGTRKYFRWEIPYPYIHHIETESGMSPVDSAHLGMSRLDSAQKAAAAAAGESAVDKPSASFLPPHPKTT